MRMKLLKIVAVLLLAGTSDSRPQRPEGSTQPVAVETSSDGWKAVRPSNGSREVREDSRYTWNSGSNRISYINNARETVGPFVGRDVEVSSGFNEPRKPGASSFRYNRPNAKLWRDPGFSDNPYRLHDHSRVNSNGGFEQFHEQPSRSFHRDAEHGSVFDRSESSRDRTSFANRRKPWVSRRIEVANDRNVMPSRVYPHAPKYGGTASSQRNPNSEDDRAQRPRFSESARSSHELGVGRVRNSMGVRVKSTRRPSLNNSGKFAAPTSGISGADSASEFLIASTGLEEAEVKHSSRFDQLEAVRKVASMLHDRNSDPKPIPRYEDRHESVGPTRVPSRRTTAHSKSRGKPKNRYASKAQSSLRKDRENTKNKTSDGQVAHLKNWPNEALQGVEDLYNYERYTSSSTAVEADEDKNDSWSLEDIRERPFSTSKNVSDDFHDASTNSSMQEIIHWLKIPAFTSNDSQFVEDERVNGPTNGIFDPIYQNLEPNLPSQPSADVSSLNNYVHQESPLNPGQAVEPQSYQENWQALQPQFPPFSHPVGSSAAGHPEIAVVKQRPSYKPLTHVTQNTVVHILHPASNRPNVTMVKLNVSETASKPVTSQISPAVSYPASSMASTSSDQVAESSDSFKGPSSPGSSVSSLSTLPSSEFALAQPSLTPSGGSQGPNVHISFTSQEEIDRDPEVEGPRVPLVTYGENCPTIMINSFTKVNNTIQSKEGCLDLNIIINSHVFNTNIFKTTTDTSAVDQSGYQDGDENDKYVDGDPEGFYSSTYQPTETGLYDSASQYQAQNDFYEPAKYPDEVFLQNDDASSDPSTVQVFQGTQISVSSADAESLSDSSASDASENPLSSEADLPSSSGSEAVANDEVPSSVVSSGGESLIGSESDAPASGSLDLPSVDQLPPSTLVDSGSALEQANDGVSNPSSGLSNRPSLSSGISNLQGQKPVGGASSPSHDDDDDDDDDDFDLSPSGLMESATSIFTYFSFFNPLNYGIFSLAAAPFAALAAGVLGIAAFLFPWAVPNAFDFGRTADKVTIRFRPSLEEVVRRSVYKYGRLNEWKSRRKKRKR